MDSLKRSLLVFFALFFSVFSLLDHGVAVAADTTTPATPDTSTTSEPTAEPGATEEPSNEDRSKFQKDFEKCKGEGGFWNNTLCTGKGLASDPMGALQALGKNTKEAPGKAAEAVANSGLEKAGKAMAETAGTIFAKTITWWVELPSPALKDSDNLREKIQGYTTDLQMILLVVSLLVVGFKFALTRYGQVESTVYETAGSLIKIVFASAVWVPLIVMLTKAGDAFSVWIIDKATAESAEKIGKALGTGLALQPGLALIVGIVVILTGIVQMVFMYVRAAMLILVAGVLPVAAASSGTAMGKQVFNQLQSWTIGLLLYKPVCALVYAIAFLAIGESDKDSWELALAGFILFSLAVFVLPTLLKLIGVGAGMAGPSGLAVGGAVAGTAMKVGSMMAGGAAGGVAGGSGGSAGMTPIGTGGNTGPATMGSFDAAAGLQAQSFSGMQGTGSGGGGGKDSNFESGTGVNDGGKFSGGARFNPPGSDPPRGGPDSGPSAPSNSWNGSGGIPNKWEVPR